MESSKKQSPLEMLVAYQQAQTFPTKAVPKDRFEKKENAITPIVEDPVAIETIFDAAEKGLVISNSSFTLNLNLNVDPKIIDKALEKSKQVAKGIAAGAAMIGTAIILGGTDRKPAKVKIPLLPKIKVPKIK